MKKWVGLFMTLLYVSFPAAAQERKVMRVGFEDYLPSASIKYGKAIGIDVELVVAAMNAVGVDVQFYMFPWSRCLHMLDYNQLDAVIPMVYSKERDEKYTLGSSLRTRANVVVLSKHVSKDVRSLRDLDGMTIGVGQGYAIHKEFDEAKNFRKESVATSGETYEFLLRKVAAGRNDGVVIDTSVVSAMARKLSIENDVKISSLRFPKASHVGFSKNNPFHPLFERGFQSIQDNGVYKKIVDQWDLQ